MSNLIAKHLASITDARGDSKTYRIEFDSDSKNPRHLRFGPEGNWQLSYMRDGIFTTDGAGSGTYTREMEFGGTNRKHHVIRMTTTVEIWCNGEKLTPEQNQ